MSAPSPLQRLIERVGRPEGAVSPDAFRARAPRPYLMLITPRSGSTWLAREMQADGRFGAPEEWLNPTLAFVEDAARAAAAPTLEDHVRAMVMRHAAPTGVSGLQAAAAQLREAFALGDPLAALGPGAGIVLLRRRDLVRQAISLHVAAMSGYWHAFDPPPNVEREVAAVTYNATAFLHHARVILHDEVWLERFIADRGLDPLRLVYEDVRADPAAALDALARRLGAGGTVPDAGAGPEVERARPVTHPEAAAWAERFRAEEAARLAPLEAARPPGL